MRHLGSVFPAFDTRRTSHENVSPDADGWVYLNLLCNLAQLHMVNVTPSFIRSAVAEKSAKFQLSPDGQKLRWRGGSDGTKFSSDSGGEYSPKDSSVDESETSNESRRQKKQKTGPARNDSKFGPQKTTTSGDSFHYKPLFIHQSSSVETSPDGSNSQQSDGVADESNPGNSKWDYSGSGSSPRKKRRHDGAITYYSGAPFCTDLSGDPGDVSPTTYMTSTGRELSDIMQSPPRVLISRTLSGSSLPVRPLSDGRAKVRDATGVDPLNGQISPSPEAEDTDDSDDDRAEFPWCDEPGRAQLNPLEPLEPCGLGGVLPEDHFAVVVTTRRTISAVSSSNSVHASRSTSADIAEVVASRLASMRTSSPFPQRVTQLQLPIEIEYLAGRLHKLQPVPLPPPAIFLSPFSSDNESDETDSVLGFDDDLVDVEDDELLSSEGLISQRANPHHSDDNYHDNEDGDEKSTVAGSRIASGDTEDEKMGGVNAVSGLGIRGGIGGKVTTVGSGSASGSSLKVLTGKRRGLVVPAKQTGSSVATAGGAESGYSSSMEDEAL